MKPFLVRHQRNCIFTYSFKFYNTHAVLVFIGYQKYSKNEKNIGEKCFGVSTLFEPNLHNLQPVTTLLSTAGALIKVSN